MSWVQWLKQVAERLPGNAAASAAAPRGKTRVRAPRRGGEAYAREWVKVLEDTGYGDDPDSTYAWELQADQVPARNDSAAASTPPPQAKKRAAPNPVADAFDTYSWDLQSGESSADPWGLSQTAPPKPVTRAQGVNPYDTGVFNESWRGRFDER